VNRTDPAEHPIELWRRRVGLVLAPLVFAALWLAPLALPTPAHRLAAVLGAVVVLWMSEAIPMAMTALLGVALAVVLGVAPAADAFAPFADPIMFLFIGSFMLARAIFFHRLDRRFALALLALPAVGARPARVLAALAFAAYGLSMWISNTATVAMMLPIGLSLLHALESERPAPAWGAALLLSISLASAFGGLATPVGTPPNLIGIGLIRRETGMDLPFFSWMTIGLPAGLLLLAITVTWFRHVAPRGDTAAGLTARLQEERALQGPWTRGQRNTALAFAVTVALWVLPGAVALALGSADPLYQALQRMVPESVAALLGAALLFVLPVDLRRLRFTLPWEEAVQIDWWIVFLYGGGIALGTLAFRTGLAEAMGRGLTGLLGVRGGFPLLAFATAFATILSETTSNTASANMVVPVVIAVARSAGIDPVLPAVGATMGASLGFMLPVSTPCNALVYASGRIPLTTMLRYGLALDAIGVAVVVALVWLLGPFALGAR
jgi:sodium-dependent dicarboxylate transporter 2/3/5